MAISSRPKALDGLLESLSSCFNAESARRLEEFDIGPDLQVRVEILADRANEGC